MVLKQTNKELSENTQKVTNQHQLFYNHKNLTMKKSICSLLFLALTTGVTAQTAAPAYQPSAEIVASQQKFSNNRFGIFLHWGIYSLFAQGEWYMTNKQIDCREYAKAANAFYPHRFDAEKWISAIKGSGARYICFTSRHHDGFSMWNTKQSDYNIMHTPFGRDVLGELAAECHRQDVGFHLYYSHIDWTRPDYPRGRTGQTTCRELKPDWKGYYNFMNAQLTELLTGYGKVDAIWFDGLWDHDQDTVPFDWELDEQYALIHRLQPACLIGNNHHDTPRPGEDIQIFERDVPGENKAGLSGQSLSRLPLETCQTMNGMWGYKVEDQNYKSTAELVALLARTAAKGANLLLNIGPQPDGQLPAAALKRLKEIGQWMKANGESIYGTEAGGFTLEDKIVSTRKADALYLHVLSDSISEIKLPVERKVKRVEALPTAAPLPYKQKKGELTFGVAVPKEAGDYVIKISY